MLNLLVRTIVNISGFKILNNPIIRLHQIDIGKLLDVEAVAKHTDA